MQPAGEACGETESPLEGGDARIAVHEQVVEVLLEALERLGFLCRIGLQQVAHRADHETGLRFFQQRNELEAHLPPAERKKLDDQRVVALEGCEQRVAAPRLPRFIHRPAVLVQKGLEVRAR